MNKKKKKHKLNYNEVYCTPGRQYCIFVAVVFTICTFNGAWLLHSNALVIQMAIDKCQAGKQARKASLTKVLTNLKLQLVMKYSHRFSMNIQSRTTKITLDSILSRVATYVADHESLLTQ